VAKNPNPDSRIAIISIEAERKKIITNSTFVSIVQQGVESDSDN
jgi:hypothetical protein